MVRLSSILLLSLIAASPASAELTRIGAAAAVSGSVMATAPGAVGRIVQSGKPLFLNDHVTTDDKGRLQVLLADETVFTLGPNSDMVLDEFVYDPATGAGKVSANITKGVFRFVTGKVARKDPEKMKVKLAVGTIGIRGTIVAGSTGPEGSTVILLGPGARNNAGENPGAILVSLPPPSSGPGMPPPPPQPPLFIDRPGFGVNMLPGAPMPPPTDMSLLAGRLMGQLGAGGGQQAPAPGAGPGSGSGSSGQGSGSGGGPGAGSGSGSGAGTGSAGDLAGQNLVNNFNTLLDTQGLGTLSQQNGQETSQALQTIADAQGSQTDNTATWEQMLNGTGAYEYTANGTYSFTNTNGSGTGLMDMSLKVDFGARSCGDYGSRITLYGVESEDVSTLINPIDFTQLTGAATITLNSDNLEKREFTGSTISFKDAASGIPATVAVSVTYNNIEMHSTASGTMTGTNVGQFTIP